MQDSQTTVLLDRAKSGDAAAIAQLLSVHRERLKRLVQVRLDNRLAVRVDASDVVQESLLRASQNLAGYLEDGSVSFYLWLRRITINHLIDVRRKHVGAGRRSVLREAADQHELSDASTAMLTKALVSPGSSPSERARREERSDQVRAALRRLNQRDREILVMRTLEQLSVAEVAETLGCTHGAVRQRQYRAIQNLRDSFRRESENSGDPSDRGIEGEAGN